VPPTSSEPSAFGGLYSKSTLAYSRLTVSALSSALPCVTRAMRTSFIWIVRYSDSASSRVLHTVIVEGSDGRCRATGTIGL